MRSCLAAVLFLTSFGLASGQIAPGPQQNTPSQPGVPQPGVPQPQPGSDPTAPNAVPGAPPAFVPGLGAGSDQPTTQPRVVRISGGVMAGNVISRVNPVYPDDARAAHISGTVVMNARVGKDGRIQNLAVVSGPRELQAAAVTAVKQWVYRPYMLNGQPVDVMTTVTINFNPK